MVNKRILSPLLVCLRHPTHFNAHLLLPLSLLALFCPCLGPLHHLLMTIKWNFQPEQVAGEVQAPEGLGWS